MFAEINIMKSPYFVREINNWHIKKDSPKEIVEEMKEIRHELYDDGYIYGNPKIHSETKDGIHLDSPDLPISEGDTPIDKKKHLKNRCSL